MLSRIKFLISFTFLTYVSFGQIPLLNSSPAITNKVIYLDFDGQVVSGTAWNSGNTVNAQASTMSSANIIQIWKRISEDYRPFDVNITTDSVRFNNAAPNKRIRVVVTPTSAWYGSAGGVAYVGSFTWGGTPGTPCWVFENQLGYSPKSIAEAAAHEVGHTLTLKHQSTYNTLTCAKTAEYNPGTGSGVTSWAPIMGVGYSKNVTIWHTGTSATGCTTIQYDHGNSGVGITSTNYLSFLPDDVGNTFGTSKILNLTSLTLSDSGLITTPSDIDTYQFTICNNRNVSIAVKPWALDTTNYSGADLDLRFFLYDAANSLLAVDTPLTKLHTLAGVNLTPGTYYFTIDGGRSSYYSDYGSLGKYYIKIKATNPPALGNTIITATSVCAGQNTSLNYSSNGTPTQWQWTISGPSANTFTTQNPSIAFSAGIHTVSLLATSASSLSCPATITLNVGSAPTISVISTNTVLCPGKTLTLSVSGASSYTWLPGVLGGSTQIVTPLSNTNYTVNGSNGTCIGSTIIPVSLSPNFTVTGSASSTNICAGESLTLTGNGATSYTFNPGNITNNPAVVNPLYPTVYIVTGKNNTCTKAAAISITVSQRFDIFLNTSATEVCSGESVTLTATGANNYTFNPGGLTGYIVVVNPTVNTTYSILAKDNGACIEDTTITITVKVCDLTRIKNEKQHSEIRIYPNPSQGNFMIETENAADKIEVLNTIGQSTYTKILTGKLTEINASGWAPGIYFVKLYNKGKIIYTEKIIVE